MKKYISRLAIKYSVPMFLHSKFLQRKRERKRGRIHALFIFEFSNTLIVIMTCVQYACLFKWSEPLWLSVASCYCLNN